MKRKKIQTGKRTLHFVLAFFFFIFSSQVAHAASIYFSPSSGNVTVGNIINTSVLVNTQGVSINNTDAVINFPTSLLEVVSVNKSGSIFSLWVEEPAFSNSAGTISFNGGVPTPGFTGGAGKLLNVTFRVRNPGLASLVFASAAVRANDGYGTDVLETRSQAQFNLVAEEKQVQPTGLGTPQAPKITSATHPDQNLWYNNANPIFSWSVPTGVTSVRLLYDKRPSSSPSVLYGAIDQKQLSDVADGAYYFHAQFENTSGWGAIGHMRFQIDTTPPELFAIRVVHESDLNDPQATIAFETTDVTSGINRYTVSVGDAAPVTLQSSDVIKSSYTLPVGQSGRQTVVVKAYDHAGNVTTESVVLTIVALEPPTITAYSKQVADGESFTVSGTTYAYANVEIIVQNSSGDTEKKSTTADASGKFSFMWTEKLNSGEYSFTALAKNVSGMTSPSSEPLTFTVFGASLVRLGSTIMEYFLFLLVFIIAIALLAAVCLVLWHRLVRLRHKLKEFTVRSGRDVQHDFERTMDDVRSLAVLLHRTKQRRELTKEEEIIFEALKQHLKKMEDNILTRLEQIDDEAGG